MDKSELFKKIDLMNEDQLWEFRTTAKLANGFIDVLGVLLILTMLIFSNFIVLGIGGIAVYVASVIAAGIGETRDYIDESLAKYIDK